MQYWPVITLACALLCDPVATRAAPIPPVPESPLRAQLPLGSGFRKRCPDIQVADAGATAVVVFWLQRNGAPSRMSIRSSSGSDALDAAAMSCVSKLQFPPATTLGDGQLIDSWQQITLAWASQGSTGETRATTSRSPDARGASAPITAAPARVMGDPRQDDAGSQANSVTVRVCADATGKLTQDPTIVRSSGRASLDQAAVKIAAAGAAYYRPDAGSSGAAASGCAQLAIRFDAR